MTRESAYELAHVKHRVLSEQIERREGCIRTYTNLLEYWSERRMIGKSDKLIQTPAFCADMKQHCMDMLEEHNAMLQAYEAERDHWAEELARY
jgi:hypothetical protein